MTNTGIERGKTQKEKNRWTDRKKMPNEKKKKECVSERWFNNKRERERERERERDGVCAIKTFFFNGR